VFLATLFAVGMMGQTAMAQGVGLAAGFFEIEGDLDPNTLESGHDWHDFINADGSVNMMAFGVDDVHHDKDGDDTSDGNQFAESVKLNSNPNTDWKWKVNGPNNKTDMDNCGVVLWMDTQSPPHLWAAMMGDRSSTNGTSFIGFEFLQKKLVTLPIKTTNPGKGKGSFASDGTDGGRTVGDIDITIQWVQGGAQPNFFADVWSPDGADFMYKPIAVPPGTAFVAANVVGNPLMGQVPVNFGAFGSTTYETNAFAETAIDVSELILGMDICKKISTLFIRTKTSHRVTAQMKDFCEPIQLSICLDTEDPVFTVIPTGKDFDCDAQVVTDIHTAIAADLADDFAMKPVAEEAVDDAAIWGSLLSEFGTVQYTDNSLNGTATFGGSSDPICTALEETLTVTYSPAVCANLGDFTVVWTVEDFCENSVDSSSVDYGVTDTTPADIVCQAPTMSSISCDSATLPTSLFVTPTATDNCTADNDITIEQIGSDVIVGEEADGCYTITRKWRAVDCTGNGALNTSTSDPNVCEVTITVFDNKGPVISGVVDKFFDCDETIPDGKLGTITATDNCTADAPTVTVGTDEPVSDDGCTEIFDRPYTATDNCGNSTTVKQRITITDTTQPRFTQVLPINLDCADSIPGPRSPEWLPQTSDDCQQETLKWLGDTEASRNACTVVIHRGWEVDDGCTTPVRVRQIITITDTTAPVLSPTPGNASVQCPDDVLDPPTVTATDDCKRVGVRFSETDNGGSGCKGDPLIITRRWFASDGCNDVSHTQTITVEDTVEPEIVDPGPQMAECDVPKFVPVSATDNCDTDVELTYDFTDCNGNPDCFAEEVTGGFEITMTGKADFMVTIGVTASDGCAENDISIEIDVTTNCFDPDICGPGRPDQLIMQYTGVSGCVWESCDSAKAPDDPPNTPQDENCEDRGNVGDTMWVVATDKELTNKNVMFFNSGQLVNLDEEWLVNGRPTMKGNLVGNTLIWMYASEQDFLDDLEEIANKKGGGKITGRWLQMVEFHTSCSACLLVGDTFGANTIVDFHTEFAPDPF